MSITEKALIYNSSTKSRDIEIISPQLAQIYQELGLIAKVEKVVGFDLYVTVDMSRIDLEEWLYT